MVLYQIDIINFKIYDIIYLTKGIMTVDLDDMLYDDRNDSLDNVLDYLQCHTLETNEHEIEVVLESGDFNHSESGETNQFQSV